MTTTFYLRHIQTGIVIPFPFSIREAAEAHRTRLNAEDRYTIYESIPPVETENEFEEHIDNELFEDQIQEEWESYHVREE